MAIMRPSYLILLLIFGIGLLTSGCQPETKNKELASVPVWAKEAIWYQIFVERFRNGDPGNDPTPADMYGSYPDKIPNDWKITSWGHDWYSHEPCLKHIDKDIRFCLLSSSCISYNQAYLSYEVRGRSPVSSELS